MNKHFALGVALLAGSLAFMPGAATAQTKTLRFVPHADLKILDPSFTTAYISRNFGYLVYDTLFGVDDKGVPRPQMVSQYSSSKDGLQWSFTLRAGLKFSDGTAVTSADCIASLKRWSARDGLGRAMLAAGAEWKAVDANSFTLTLKEPFGLVLDALAKPSGFPPIILPERLANMPTTAPLTEVLGSGPYTFKRDEWVPGAKVVFQRNPLYVGRSEASSALSGNKQGKIERIEWLYLPDSNSSTAALKNGEVDMIEIVPPDYITQLGTDSNLKVASGGTLQGLVVMNHLHPPFNNASARQAVLLAVNQEKMTAALGYPAEMRMKYCGSYFICGGANDSAAGSAPYRNNDVARAKQLLANAGYKGEKVTLLMPTDIPAFNSASLVLAQALKGIGMNVDTVSMDWASITARRAKKDVPEQGGWNLYLTQAGEFDVNSPATSSILSAACGNSIPGWPCDKPLDELRAAWMKENVPAKRRELLDGFQARAFETVPYISFGQFTAAYAARKSIKNTEIMWGAIPTPWMLDK